MRARISSLVAAIAVTATLAACGAPPEPTPTGSGNTGVTAGTNPDPAAEAAKALAKQVEQLGIAVAGQFSDGSMTYQVSADAVDGHAVIRIRDVGTYKLDEVVLDGHMGATMPLPSSTKVTKIAVTDPTLEAERVPGN